MSLRSSQYDQSASMPVMQCYTTATCHMLKDDMPEIVNHSISNDWFVKCISALMKRVKSCYMRAMLMVHWV
jgi:hypothetical protein